MPSGFDCLRSKTGSSSIRSWRSCQGTYLLNNNPFATFKKPTFLSHVGCEKTIQWVGWCCERAAVQGIRRAAYSRLLSQCHQHHFYQTGFGMHNDYLVILFVPLWPVINHTIIYLIYRLLYWSCMEFHLPLACRTSRMVSNCFSSYSYLSNYFNLFPDDIT